MYWGESNTKLERWNIADILIVLSEENNFQEYKLKRNKIHFQADLSWKLSKLAIVMWWEMTNKV